MSLTVKSLTMSFTRNRLQRGSGLQGARYLLNRGSYEPRNRTAAAAQVEARVMHDARQE